MKDINAVVFPSTENTISVKDDAEYGGAHQYEIQECRGFNPNTQKTEYSMLSTQRIRFIEKNSDGSMFHGLQSEQLVLMLIDRTNKLDARFPSPFNQKAIEGLQMFLDASKERVEDRMNRDVMGELKS